MTMYVRFSYFVINDAWSLLDRSKLLNLLFYNGASVRVEISFLLQHLLEKEYKSVGRRVHHFILCLNDHAGYTRKARTKG